MERKLKVDQPITTADRLGVNRLFAILAEQLGKRLAVGPADGKVF